MEGRPESGQDAGNLPASVARARCDVEHCRRVHGAVQAEYGREGENKIFLGQGTRSRCGYRYVLRRELPLPEAWKAITRAATNQRSTSVTSITAGRSVIAASGARLLSS